MWLCPVKLSAEAGGWLVGYCLLTVFQRSWKPKVTVLPGGDRVSASQKLCHTEPAASLYLRLVSMQSYRQRKRGSRVHMVPELTLGRTGRSLGDDTSGPMKSKSLESEEGDRRVTRVGGSQWCDTGKVWFAGVEDRKWLRLECVQSLEDRNKWERECSFSLYEGLRPWWNLGVWGFKSPSLCNVTSVTENEQHSLGILRNPNYP